MVKSSEDSNVGMNYKVITFSPKETPFQDTYYGGQ